MQKITLTKDDIESLQRGVIISKPLKGEVCLVVYEELTPSQEDLILEEGLEKWRDKKEKDKE